ncbi:hypothetical protein GCM10025877_18220 [Agromyces mangrovi Wang et al. 2018]|nr:hypothetical protein GCM10025877_18220 [Agromyces mangrovi]
MRSAAARAFRVEAARCAFARFEMRSRVPFEPAILLPSPHARVPCVPFQSGTAAAGWPRERGDRPVRAPERGWNRSALRR